ncbi:MAG TPA: DUF6164 family protein [Cellvibrio sp.]|nr:DUF6164 family protein [Cellvibrio sp.]
MAILLFRLNNVPDDEASDIRELLQAQDIYFYETHAGFWRLGVDAIWLVDDTHAEQARELIRDYQAQRAESQHKTYIELVEQGKAPTLWQNFCAAPVRFSALVIATLFILALTLLPFGMLMRQ